MHLQNSVRVLFLEAEVHEYKGGKKMMNFTEILASIISRGMQEMILHMDMGVTIYSKAVQEMII